MLVVKDFWAPWCRPCVAFKPILEELAQKYSDHVRFEFINVDEDAQSSSTYSIRGVPTVIFEKDGKQIDRVVGAQSKNKMIELIDKHLIS